MSSSSKPSRLKGFFKDLTKSKSRTTSSLPGSPISTTMALPPKPSTSQEIRETPAAPPISVPKPEPEPDPKIAPPRVTNKQAWLGRGIAALNVLSQLASSTDILSPLKIASDAATKVLETVKAMDDNDEAWKALRKTLEANIADFQKQIERLENEDMADDEDSPLFRPIEEYRGALEELLGDLLVESGISENELREKTKGDYWMRMKRFMSRFGNDAARIGTLTLEASRIKLYNSSLNEAMQRFLVSMTLYMAFEVQETSQKLTRIERTLKRKPTNREINAHGRQHHECLEGTRIGILEDIDQWSQRADGKQIYCIEDLAGTGKSTIAYHLASKWEEEGRLAGRFFFTRGNSGTETASDLCFGIAEELAFSFGENPQLREIVKRLLEDKNALSKFSIRKQWDKLVVAPLRHLNDCVRLLVIDALDECSISTLPSLLDCIRAFSLDHIKVLLTTRPERPIRQVLGTIPSITIQHIRQSEVEKQDNLADVARYINHELDHISCHIDQQFSPSTAQRTALIDRSEGLFIFASTACAFLRITYVRQDALEQILAPNVSSKLDDLYKEVLRRSIPENDSDAKAVQRVLSLIISAAEPISPNIISTMLPRSINVKQIVRSLASVVASSEDDEPVYILHTTFREFLLQKRRSSKYTINIHIGHSLFARSSFELLLGERKPIKVDTCATCKENGYTCDDLRRDICHAVIAGSPFPENKNIENLDECLTQHVSPGLRYAAIHWMSHAAFLLHKDEILQIMVRFFETKLLYWIELLGLLGVLGPTIVGVNKLQHVAQRCPDLQESDVCRLVSEWLKDVLNLIRTNQPLLEVSSLHIYTSALLWHDPASLISSHHGGSYTEDTLHTIWGVDKKRLGYHSLSGHPWQVAAIAFSPSGEYTTSISVSFSRGFHPYLSVGFHIIQWDAACYAKLWELHVSSRAIDQTHERTVPLYSPDSRKISLLTNNILILLRMGRRESPAMEMWRWERGQDDDHPSAMAWHPKGDTLICGMVNGDLLLANAATGERMERVPAHSKHIYHLRISNNGSVLASVSTDGTIAAWVVDPEGGLQPTSKPRLCRLEREGFDPFVTALEFINNHQIAYILSNNPSKESVPYSEYYVWDLHGHEGKLCGHEDHFEAIILCPNGEMAIFKDNAIMIRDFQTGEGRKILSKLVQPMDYLSRRSAYMTYYPSNQQIYVGLSGGRIIIWDLNEEGPTDESPLHGSMQHLSLSTDLNSLASYEHNGRLKVWDIATRKVRCTIEENFHYRESHYRTPIFTFSPNGSRIAVLTVSNDIFVCDSVSGATIGRSANSGTQVRYKRWIPTGITLSPDGTQIVTTHRNIRSDESCVFLWKLTAKTNSVTFECEVLTQPKDALYVDSERYIGTLLHLSDQYLLFGTRDELWTWDVTGSLPAPVDSEIVPLLLAETADKAYVETKEYGIGWIVVGSPPRYSFALPADFEITAHSVKSSCMALGSSDGRIIIIDYDHLIERYPMDVEYWKPRVWETTDDEISRPDEICLVSETMSLDLNGGFFVIEIPSVISI